MSTLCEELGLDDVVAANIVAAKRRRRSTVTGNAATKPVPLGMRWPVEGMNPPPQPPVTTHRARPSTTRQPTCITNPIAGYS